MELLNALQLKNGRTAEGYRPGGSALQQPVQMLPRQEKDETWCAWNLDWHELVGLRQVHRNARWMLKNYKLAAGLIDRSDYIPEQVEPEHQEMFDVLTENGKQNLGTGQDGAFDLKFFPIIPNIINVLTGEFQKRTDKITYHATDDFSYHDLLQQKYQAVEQTLLADAEQTMRQKLQAQGMDFDSEEAQQALSPDSLRSLPEIEQFFRKDYQSLYEQWATHQHNVDVERFRLSEQQTRAWQDMLVVNRSFFSFELGEDDYAITDRHPLLFFSHNSPHVPYVSEGNYAGWFELMSTSDVLNTLGWQMSQQQQETFKEGFATYGPQYAQLGVQDHYDATKSYEWNTQGAGFGGSLGMRQLLSVSEPGFLGVGSSEELVKVLLGGQDPRATDDPLATSQLHLVTTVYWKSQLKLGHLTSVDENGISRELIVDESFRVTTRPVYDNSLLRGKCRETLLYGEHVEWMWINQTWGGKKISRLGPLRQTAHTKDETGFEPIYLNVQPLRFQFKGDYSLYNCKLPVEGRVFADRGVRAGSIVDRLKPYQLGFNLVNNQIADILIDELGTVIVLDQNALPKSSLGEDYQDDRMGKAYAVMKDMSILALDTGIQNTETPMNFQHYQALNLEQTARLMSRVQLANYFKQQAFEAIGITPERLGAVNAQQSGTNIEQAVNMSYSQTEVLFTQFCDELMPRVHQMRTDLAQHYHSTRPSVRLSYVTSKDERVNFELNGTELLGRDLNVFCSTKVNTRDMMEKMRTLALNNNTGGESLFELAQIIKAQTPSELESALQAGQQRAQQEREQDMSQQQAMQQQMDEAAMARQKEMQDHELLLQENLLQNNIDVAEIKGSGFQTPDDSADYMESLKLLEGNRRAEADRELKRQGLELTRQQLQQDAQLRREELAQKRQQSQDAVQVARINKNKYDKPKPTKKK